MKIESIKDLTKLITTCRKLGVDKITVDGVVLELGVVPEPTYKPRRQLSVQETVQEVIETSGMTPDEILFMSAGGGYEG